MAILIEGPDNSGKSTLAKALAGVIDWPIVSAGSSSDGKDWEKRCLLDIERAQTNVIMDRSFIISEPVYGAICRNVSHFNPKPWIKKLNYLSEINDLIIIFCLPPKEIVANMTTHVIKITDTPKHLEQISRNADKLYNEYKFISSAFMVFGDVFIINPYKETNLIIDTIKEMIQ